MATDAICVSSVIYIYIFSMGRRWWPRKNGSGHINPPPGPDFPILPSQVCYDIGGRASSSPSNTAGRPVSYSLELVDCSWEMDAGAMAALHRSA
jgi:hypothetical protein